RLVGVDAIELDREDLAAVARARERHAGPEAQAIAAAGGDQVDAVDLVGVAELADQERAAVGGEIGDQRELGVRAIDLGDAASTGAREQAQHVAADQE